MAIAAKVWQRRHGAPAAPAAAHRCAAAWRRGRRLSRTPPVAHGARPPRTPPAAHGARPSGTAPAQRPPPVAHAAARRARRPPRTALVRPLAVGGRTRYRCTTMLTHRADFARNERRILDAAAQVLAASPSAGMARIADVAGLGRATLYRHFPTREALLEGLRAEALDAAGAVIARCVTPVLDRAPGAPSPATALERVTEELVAVGDRYRLILREEEPWREEARRRFELPLTRLVERAQAAGELDDGVPASWVVLAFGGLLGRALDQLAEGRLDADEARRIVVRGLLDGFRARA